MHYALTFFRNSGIGITEINCEDIQTFLAEKARKYS